MKAFLGCLNGPALLLSFCGSGDARSLPRFSVLTVIAVEKRSATRCESDLRIVWQPVAFELNQAVDDCVFPNRLSRAVALPCFHGLVVTAAAIGDPGKKL